MAPSSDDSNGWKEWSKHVLAELKRLNECYEKLDESIQGMKIDLAMLKVKSGIWGAIAGFVPSAAALIYILLRTTK